MACPCLFVCRFFAKAYSRIRILWKFEGSKYVDFPVSGGLAAWVLKMAASSSQVLMAAGAPPCLAKNTFLLTFRLVQIL